MTITQNVPNEVYDRISSEQMSEIWKYIEEPMTASTVNDTNGKKSNKSITAEVIYYWMIALNIPVEFQKWHLNKLLMLIRVCDNMNTPPKKLTKNELYSRNNALNNARRAASHSKG